MNQLKGLLYFFLVDIRHSMMIFWTILLSILVVCIAFGFYLDAIDGGMMTFSLTAPIYIYCSILAFNVVKEFIPFSIKLGATRKNIFISIGIFFFLLAITKAVVASILQEAISFFTKVIGIEDFYFLHLAYFVNDTWYIRIGMDVMLIFFLMSLMFMLGLVFYRHGFLGGGISLGVAAVVLLFGIAQGWLIDFIVDLVVHINMVFFLQLFAVGLLLYLASFAFLKQITIIKVR
ncbi:hypothetical protein PD280_00190 [Virgibacillus salarius]|uniref:hypothetical protein n=1 Tax=Virgibacillus salarius TaxID=447199 RepID=UPI0004102F7D|nr:MULTISPECIES: hypothetical protein [Bacillaceae]WBX80366.1 hypothetical protein PD280_00190 [Virgibacillus salarius]